jgi:dienelactone hydrolase
VSIAFDASHKGSSEGLPHYLENPNSGVSDVSAVVDYLQGLDYVNVDLIVVLGICVGGGYAVAAATTNHPHLMQAHHQILWMPGITIALLEASFLLLRTR